MNRALRILSVCALGLAAACTSPDASDPSDPPPPTEDKVAITAFHAAPDAIEAGQTAMLKFTVEPADAQVTITEVGAMGAQTEVPVHPTATTTYHLTAIKGTARAEASITVTVAPQPVVSLLVTPVSETSVAGEALGVTLTAIALNGLPTPSYRGTVKLTSSDAAAVIGGEVSFGAADNGVKQAKLELRTAGLAAVSAIDVNNPGLRGAAAVLVKPAVASACNTAQVPSAALAGSTIGLSVALHDRFGNLATGYNGTIRLATTDVRAPAPGEVTYTAADNGSHVFSAVLITAGPQMLAATDTANAAIHCEAGIMITPGIPKIVLTAPANAKAGFPLAVNVQMRDVFDNAIPAYAGTVSFTSSDGAAAVPAPIAFTGGEGGMATTSVTFMTRGTQVLDAHDAGSPVATGSAAAAVVGLVYTPPTTGRVRLVANAAQSTAQVVQLDMVANERLEISTLFGGGPGSFATGMNLPLDTTRVGADTTLITRGAALPAGTGVPATAAAIGTDNVLYAAVSRKRAAGAVFGQSTEVQAGQVFYSVRLRLSASATTGPVFDGALPSPMFRASVRDQYGDDFVSQSDFGIGKLEVQ
jgi:hypothetical protein